MTAIADLPDQTAGTPVRAFPGLFVLTVFASALLVFMVEPMMTRLILPLLGGSAAVWNTSLAFFQIALLAGYVYAHLLQLLRRVGIQILIHIAVLLGAAFCLPLHVTAVFGQPSANMPALWLVGVLTVSLGAPFASLSATAPLIQAWYARTIRHEGAGEPYALYAASNLGSLIALVVYPVLVEPNVGLHSQTAIWSLCYCVFMLLAGALGMVVWRAKQYPTAAAILSSAGVDIIPERLTWLALAAAASSLMLGVTNFITSELGSAPFLWVLPLALYLCTFVIAFHRHQVIRPQVTLGLQAPILAICALLFWVPAFLSELGLHLVCFFVTALVCHQALVARRPPPDRLTDFYVWISIGGVVGGAFNAFVAPLVFTNVVEYPAVLVLSCLARPWGRGPVNGRIWLAAFVSMASAIGAVFLVFGTTPAETTNGLPAFVLLSVAALCALALRGRAVLFAAAILTLLTAGNVLFNRTDVLHRWRNFFGVLSVSHQQIGGLGDVKMLRHGTTLHGAQSSLPAYRCRPLTYYAPETPIGQVFKAVQSRKSAVNVGVVGLGTGTVAAYTRPGDSLRFFEIDPIVIQVATNPEYFSYTTACARGRIRYTLGDARLMLASRPSGTYDILLIDAFSSDSVPAHLLTVEALRMYLSKLTPDGVLILHLSNRHLDLMHPAMAAASAVGTIALQQTSKTASSEVRANIWIASEQAVILGKSRAALEFFRIRSPLVDCRSKGCKALDGRLYGCVWRAPPPQHASGQLTAQHCVRGFCRVLGTRYISPAPTSAWARNDRHVVGPGATVFNPFEGAEREQRS